MNGDAREVTLVAHEVGTPGGMERAMGELAGGLLERGYRVVVVAHGCELSEHPALRWVRVGGPRRPFSLWYPWFFLFGSLAVWRHGRGMVHTLGAIVGNRADVSTVQFCHRAFAKRGVTRVAHGTVAHRLNSSFVAAMSGLAELCCYRPACTRHLAAVSEGIRRELHEHFPAMGGAVSVIPNAANRDVFAPDELARRDSRARLGLEADDLVALFVGGDWERKGLRYVVDAVGQAPEWHLLVVGQGDDGGFRRLATQAGAEGRVHFVGGSTQIAPYYASADAFVFPTAYEAFPLVILEAAAAGLPLVASRVNGIEDILVDGENGWFVERDGAAIAARLHELGADGERRRAMGRAAREASARFTWDAVVDAYDDLYDGLRA